MLVVFRRFLASVLLLDFLLLDSFDQRLGFSIIVQQKGLLAGLHSGSLSWRIGSGKAAQNGFQIVTNRRNCPG